MILESMNDRMLNGKYIEVALISELNAVTFDQYFVFMIEKITGLLPSILILSSIEFSLLYLDLLKFPLTLLLSLSVLVFK